MTTAEKARVETPGPEKVADKPGADKAAPDKRRALGRGLDSLLPSGPRVVTPSAGPSTPAFTSADRPANAGVISGMQAQAAKAPSGDTVQQLALDQIDQNPYQTRLRFNAELLEELAQSIRTSGLVQPIVVRPTEGGRYVLILGERRCRASKLAGKETIPAIVRRVSDQQAAEMTVVENLQRQDLSCLEQAAAFAKLSRDFGLTQEQIGQRTGVSRESVSNYMRLLKLPGTVMQYLQEGRLGFSEARVLLRLMDPTQIPRVADEAVRKQMSVQQLEELVDQTNVPLLDSEKAQASARWIDPNVRAAQGELERVLGVRVRIKDRKGRGKIVIEYSTLEDYDRVISALKGKAS
ncbi:MAG: ParB/RepB/Spo0J family partition protein [Acidobacteriaceae bacterium]